MIFPRSKSTPRAFCAFIMRSSSSSSVGTKRRAIVIIIASSCTGTPTRRSGESSASRPSVRRRGLVVSVNSVLRRISRIRRSPMYAPRTIPSHVAVRNPIRSASVPGVIKRCTAKVKSTIQRIGRIERSCIMSGTRENTMRSATAHASAAKPAAFSTKKISSKKKKSRTIFTRGSMRCRNESPGR